MEINIREIYDNTVLIDELNLYREATLLNCLIYQLISDCIWGKYDSICEGDDISLIYDIIDKFCLITKYTEKLSNKNHDEVFKIIHDGVESLNNEIVKNNNTYINMCYDIGASSELGNNYSIIQKIIIISYLLQYDEIKIDF